MDDASLEGSTGDVTPQASDEEEVQALDMLHESNDEIESSEFFENVRSQVDHDSGLSIYAEQRRYHHGKVVDSSSFTSGNPLHVSHGFSQAFVSEKEKLSMGIAQPGVSPITDEAMLQQSSSLLYSMGVKIFFVQKSATDHEVAK